MEKKTIKNSFTDFLLSRKIGSFIFCCLIFYMGFSGVVSAQNLPKMKIDFLDIGQGDSIYIEAPNGHQLLVDGGRDNRVIKKLQEVMPYGDNSLDVIIATHPDADHVGGLNDVIKKYSIGAVLEPGVSATTKTYQSLESLIIQKNIPHILARRGMQIVLDEKNGIYVEILFPDRDTTGWETNSAAIVAKLIYGKTSVILTADAPIKNELYLIGLDKQNLKTNILKLGHHGSRTSSSEQFLRATSPDLAIISAGKNNSYGHPHKEVLDFLQRLNIPYLTTYNDGTIKCESDSVVIDCK